MTRVSPKKKTQKYFYSKYTLQVPKRKMNIHNTHITPEQEVKFKQFEHENETWKRLLEFLQIENVHLKTRLANITRESITKDLLEQIEYYQNQFVKEDETIALLRHDVAGQQHWLTREFYEDGSIWRELLRKQEKLRREIEIAEQRFNKLKFEFNNYLAANL